MNADGTKVTRLTDDPAADVDPAWSPDGTKIAFSSGRDENPKIYVMNADGTGVAPLTDDPAFDVTPRWSPTTGVS
jgi:TolB protein